MKKPYQIEALRAVKRLGEMAGDGNPAIQMVLPMAEMVGWLHKGVGELVRCYMNVIKLGGEMKVVGLSAKVEEIFKITQLYRIIQDFGDEEAALQSFPENRKKLA